MDLTRNERNNIKLLNLKRREKHAMSYDILYWTAKLFI